MGKTRFTIFGASILVIIVLLLAMVCDADTIVMRDNEKVKGVVVEDFQDRVVLSTMEGEQEIMKADVARIVYDNDEQNFTSLGDFYADRGMYTTAYYYYGEALKVNPNYPGAKEGFHFVTPYVNRLDRMFKEDEIKRRNVENKFGQQLPEKDQNLEAKEVQRKVGVILEDEEGLFKIIEVLPNSPAVRAGIEKGDVLVKIYGRTVTYMRPIEVMRKLLAPGALDISIVIQRSFKVRSKDVAGKYSDVIGADLVFKEVEGLSVKSVKKGGVAEKAGIKKGDIIVELHGVNTRYMTPEEMTNIIESMKGDVISLIIRRKTTVYRRIA